MATLTGRLSRDGALVEVKIMQSESRVDALKLKNLPFATPVVILGLIDTGASSTVLDSYIVSLMGLDFRGPVAVQTPTTGSNFESRDTYDVTLVFGEGQPDPFVMTVLAISSDIASQGFYILIGRDILDHGVLTYDGPAGTFRLDF